MKLRNLFVSMISHLQWMEILEMKGFWIIVGLFQIIVCLVLPLPFLPWRRGDHRLIVHPMPGKGLHQDCLSNGRKHMQIPLFVCCCITLFLSVPILQDAQSFKPCVGSILSDIQVQNFRNIIIVKLIILMEKKLAQ